MLKEKTVLVTGGSRGIGKAVALKMAELGANVAIIATSDGEAAQNTLKELKASGCKAGLYVCDISDEKQVKDTVDSVLKDYGQIDVLVNNAGITRDKLMMAMTEDDIDSVIDVNLKGTLYMTKACIRPFMKQRKGSIINISSVVGLMGNAGQANYAASKAGVIGVTKTVAKEYAARGIRCNAIAPGYICTDMTGSLGEAESEKIKKMIPSGRFGNPEDVAFLAAFLASDNSSYITGEVIKVDGGMYI